MKTDKNKMCLYGLLIFLIFLTGCDFMKTPAIKGQVIDLYGKPVSDVLIKLENSNYISQTDKDGRYTLEYSPGTFKILFSKEGYSKHEMSLSLSSKSTFLAESVSIIKLPTQKGVYLLSETGMEMTRIKSHSIGIAGTFFQSVSGVKNVSIAARTNSLKPTIILYGEDYSADNLSLCILSYLKYKDVQNIGGTSRSEVNMWVADSKVDVEINSYKSDVPLTVLTPKSDLLSAIYAIHWGALYAGDPLTVSGGRKNVYTIAVGAEGISLQQKEKENILNSLPQWLYKLATNPVIPGVGVAGLSIGDPESTIKELLGTPTEGPTPVESSGVINFYTTQYKFKGMFLGIYTTPQSRKINSFRLYDKDFDTNEILPNTQNGIGIGVIKEELLKSMGSPIETDFHNTCPQISGNSDTTSFIFTGVKFMVCHANEKVYLVDIP